MNALVNTFEFKCANNQHQNCRLDTVTKTKKNLLRVCMLSGDINNVLVYTCTVRRLRAFLFLLAVVLRFLLLLLLLFGRLYDCPWRGG